MRTAKQRRRSFLWWAPDLLTSPRRALYPLWLPLRLPLARMTVGGAWAEQVGQSIRHNLRWFFLDGVFAHTSESIVVAYLPLFVLALGANRTQIGLMSALSSLSGAILLLPGAALVERSGRRKLMVLLGGGGGARAALILLAVAPFFLSGPLVVAVVIGLAVARSAFINLSIPAWTSLTADIVPAQWRGRYFSSRNIGMSIVAMTSTFAVGQLINRTGGPAGYQLAMALAFAAGLVATFSFAHIRETRGKPPQSTYGSRLPLWQRLRTHPQFLMFCGVTAVWNLSLGVAGPFFSPYMVESLGASAGTVGLLTVTTTLAALPGQRLFGILTDRWGPHRVQLVTGLLIPLVPWGWALTRSPWHVVPVDAVAGFLWAGYGLASFNFLLLLSPEERRSRYSALYQVAATLALAVGSAMGGVLATAWGYRFVFAVSGIGRLVAALLFAGLIRSPATDQACDKNVMG